MHAPLPPWVAVHGGALVLAAVRRHCVEWFAFLDDELGLAKGEESDVSATMWRCRAAALAVRGAGHGRAGASRDWRELGISSAASASRSERGKEAWVVNPTLYDLTASSAPVPAGKEDDGDEELERFPCTFLEDQGPSGAFACLRGLRAGSREFWRWCVRERV